MQSVLRTFYLKYINERTLLCGRSARLGRSARTKKKNEWGSFGPDRGEKTLAIDTPGAISVRSLPSFYIVGPNVHERSSQCLVREPMVACPCGSSHEIGLV